MLRRFAALTVATLMKRTRSACASTTSLLDGESPMSSEDQPPGAGGLSSAVDRRRFLTMLASLPLLMPKLEAADPTGGDPHAGHAALADIPDLQLVGGEAVAMLVYPGFTALDLVGPHYFYASLMGADIQIVTTESDLSPVASDLQLAISPTVTMDSYSGSCDVLFLPGGTRGTLEAMRSERVRSFVRKQSENARFVTATCTGSLILAAAGLLKGRKASTHWLARERLADFGAIPSNQRVTMDGKFVTGAGVSAGLDMALAVDGALRGASYAKALMLQGEYAPEPPFKGGTPENTDPRLVQMFRDKLKDFDEQTKNIAQELKLTQ